MATICISFVPAPTPTCSGRQSQPTSPERATMGFLVTMKNRSSEGYSLALSVSGGAKRSRLKLYPDYRVDGTRADRSSLTHSLGGIGKYAMVAYGLAACIVCRRLWKRWLSSAGFGLNDGSGASIISNAQSKPTLAANLPPLARMPSVMAVWSLSVGCRPSKHSSITTPREKTSEAHDNVFAPLNCSGEK